MAVQAILFCNEFTGVVRKHLHDGPHDETWPAPDRVTQLESWFARGWQIVSAQAFERRTTNGDTVVLIVRHAGAARAG
jgi:hypothetical protein